MESQLLRSPFFDLWILLLGEFCAFPILVLQNSYSLLLFSRIDGIDITTIGLQDLRSRLTLIPQEAVLFTGTVRTNLDPFNQHTDSECMDALERVQMVNTFASTRPSAVPSRIGSPFPGSATPVPGASIDAGARPILAASVLDLVVTKDTASEETRVDSGRLGVTLETKVSQGGHNFSAGQRQLLAMARALLRRSKIIIMDEVSFFSSV